MPRSCALHLQKRRRDTSRLDVGALAAATEGFSGAELEQSWWRVVVASPYGAFAERSELEERQLRDEIGRTRPLSATMKEPIEELRR